MTTSKLSKSGRLIALLSFIIGTIIFALYYFTDGSGFLFLGYGFIVIAGVINLVILIQLLIQLRQSNNNKRNIIVTCGLMLINLPIMLLYCWVATILLNTMRISFINETAATLTNINIVGCEKNSIAKLEPGECKEIWVGIPNDCAIDIDFLSAGQRQSENVLGYTTANMGQRITYNIGRKKSPATNNK